MTDIKALIRPNILALKPYSSARDDFEGGEAVFLDANELPFGNLNRYPDPYQRMLKSKLSQLKGIAAENIFLGNGSDEVIDLALRIFCIPGRDRVIVCPPTYGMYEVSAGINHLEVMHIPLTENFQLNVDEILKTEAKMVFLCSPNNPTGNTLQHLETIIRNFKGIVFLDEAYIDFSERPSLLHKVNTYPNLIVSQTLSKAWGKAAIRIGIAYADKEIITFFNKVKPPYNISQLNQNEAIQTIEKADVFYSNRQKVLEQRSWLLEQLSELEQIEKIYPTDANFVLVKTKNANAMYHQLIENKIVVRNRHFVVENCLRITVGEANENAQLIDTLKKMRP